MATTLSSLKVSSVCVDKQPTNNQLIYLYLVIFIIHISAPTGD